MALRKLERRNYGRKSPVSIKYQNLHSFKEGLILLCQSILETRRLTHLHGSVHFTIQCVWNSKSKKWPKRKSINFTMWFEKKKCQFPRFLSFRFCPILEIENLKTSESLRLRQILNTSVARLKPFTESQINVACQINKDTV